MIKVPIVYIGLAGLLTCGISCKKDQKIENVRKSELYIDSMSFRHYARTSKPYLINSKTYAFSDSLSEVLDSLNLDTLIKMNSTDRSYDDPLSYTQIGDTVIVDLIYTPNYGRFPFAEIKSRNDSIFVMLSGDVFKEIPKISDDYRVPYRYFKSKFRILGDSTIVYKIFYRRDII